MLERVALNQTRFNVPGVAPDNRGILLGKQAVVLFASVDRLVGFLRVLGDEGSLDDLLPKLKIHQVRSHLGSRELLVLFHAATSYLVDRAARAAGLFGGLAFTGSGKHFVKYRDDHSPLGYDVGSLLGEGGEFVLYSDTFTQALDRAKDVPLDQLVFRLSLRQVPGEPLDEVDRELVWLVVREGLARGLLGYLWRNRVRAEASRLEAPGGSFAAGGALYLVRVTDLPLRMLRLFRAVPGIELHQPISDNAVVELGYRHPLRLESCTSVFDKERFYVFSGSRDTVDLLRALPVLVPAAALVSTGFDLQATRETQTREPAAPPRFGVPLMLVPSPGARRRVTATLVRWDKAAWLRRVVYALPPTLLDGYRVAAIKEGLFVLGEQGIDGLPIGDLYQEAAPSIYVPIGHEFLPRVSPQVLTEHVGGVAGRKVVFLGGAAHPVALDNSLFEALGRRSLAALSVEGRERDSRLGAARAVVPATVVNEDAGALPLWGFRGGPSGDEA
jgi:hypothetical protein